MPERLTISNFRPKKNYLRLEPRLDHAEALTQQIEEAGLDVMEYNRRNRYYRLQLTKPDIKTHAELLTDLLQQAYKSSSR